MRCGLGSPVYAALSRSPGFGYLGAIKEMNGAAMSVGRVSSFFDIYIERDIKEGTLTEEVRRN